MWKSVFVKELLGYFIDPLMLLRFYETGTSGRLWIIPFGSGCMGARRRWRGSGFGDHGRKADSVISSRVSVWTRWMVRVLPHSPGVLGLCVRFVGALVGQVSRRLAWWIPLYGGSVAPSTGWLSLAYDAA